MLFRSQIMRAFLHKYGKDWDESAAYACYAINTHIISGTTVTPSELVFGRKPEDPNSVAVQDEELWGVKADQQGSVYQAPVQIGGWQNDSQGDEDAGPGQGRQHGQVQEGRFQVRCCSWLHQILNGSWEVSTMTGVFAGFGTAGLSPGRRL